MRAIYPSRGYSPQRSERSRPTLPGTSNGFDRLARAIEFDDFEAALFEVVVAARYAVHPAITDLAFIPASSTPTPDFSVQTRRGRLHVECKKFDRMTDASPRIRDAVRDATTPLIHVLDSEKVSAVIEWKIATETPQLDPQQLVRDAFGALASGGAIVRPEGTVFARGLVPLDPPENLILIPSPAYFWDQFEYASGGPWHGLVDAHRGRMAGPSYAVALSWVAGVKWAVTNEKAMQRARRFGYARVFKGLEQLEAAGEDTVLHVCLERIAGVGPRVAELKHFVETLKEKRKRFGWLVFNEFEIDVTMGGRFDFQEHAHFVPGSRRFGKEPPVSMVFVPGSGVTGPFGVGATLPPLDDE
ncbi:MAG: hypothetical protein QM704_00435 [Anaeromyxobacteraceae bacterium]